MQLTIPDGKLIFSQWSRIGTGNVADFYPEKILHDEASPRTKSRRELFLWGFLIDRSRCDSTLQPDWRTVIQEIAFDDSLGIQAPKQRRTFKTTPLWLTTSLLSEGEIRGLMEMLGTLNTSLLNLQETGREPTLFPIWFIGRLWIVEVSFIASHCVRYQNTRRPLWSET